MDIRKYYLAEAGYDNTYGRVAAPKPVVDLLLAEKYGWTPQQIDAIPKTRMEEMMMVMNMRLNVDAEVQMRKEHQDEDSGPPTIGSGVRRAVQLT